MAELKFVLESNFGFYRAFDFGDFALDIQSEEEGSQVFLTFVPYPGQDYSSFSLGYRSGDIFFTTEIPETLVEEFRLATQRAREQKSAINDLVNLLNSSLLLMMDNSERYLPTGEYGSQQERLEGLLQVIETDQRMYRREDNMNYDTVERHCEWLQQLKTDITALAGELSEPEQSALLSAAETIYPLNFYTGTGYGTCYGAPQLLHIVRTVRENHQSLEQEIRIPYINALCRLFELRAERRAIPLHSVLTTQSEQEFPYGTIHYMNNQLAAAQTPEDKLTIIEAIIKEAEEQ